MILVNGFLKILKNFGFSLKNAFIITMKLRFYFFCEFMHFFHGPGQMSITLMDFTFLQPHVLPQFAPYFSSPDYENLCGFTFCSLALRISYSRQWTFFPVSKLHVVPSNNSVCLSFLITFHMYNV
jgi:hypothetical protein